MPPCKDYLNGRCLRGNACRYQHSIDTTTVSGDREGSRDGRDVGSDTWRQEMKTINNESRKHACEAFQSLLGCDRGSRCPYAHVGQEGAKICSQFSSGSGRGCSHGLFCKFRHPGVDPEIQIRNIAGRTCRDFQLGRCARGSHCRYRHTREEVEVCRDFLSRFGCRAGSRCVYHHPDQTEKYPINNDDDGNEHDLEDRRRRRQRSSYNSDIDEHHHHDHDDYRPHRRRENYDYPLSPLRFPPPLRVVNAQPLFRPPELLRSVVLVPPPIVLLLKRK